MSSMMVAALLAPGCASKAPSQPPASGQAEQPAEGTAPDTDAAAKNATGEHEAPSVSEAAAPLLSAEAAKRESEAKELLDAVGSSVEMYLETRGRLAVNALSDPALGLEATQRKALEALSDPRLEPSQRVTIIRAMVKEEPGISAMMRACNVGLDALIGRFDESPTASHGELTMKQCGVEALAMNANPSKAQWASVLLSAVMAEVLRGRGEATPSEIALCRYVALLDYPIEK